jgi:hypothetical protein
MSKCKKCGETVVWREKPNGGFFPPENPDGSRHDCENKSAGKPGGDSIVGRLDSYTSGSATFAVQDGSLKTYAITPGMAQEWRQAGFLQPPEIHADVWLEFTKDKAAFIQPGWKTVQKPAWAAQLSDPTQQKPAQPAAAPPQETCTSPNAVQPEQQQAKPDTWSREREEFYQLLKSAGREGMPALLEYLTEKTDFFIAPSSTKYHDARDGGLLHHSLTAYHNLVALSRIFAGDYPEDTLKIIGLLHDVCKANFYKTSTRNVKKELAGGFSEWVKEPYIDIDDQFPLGHGEKSTILIQRYLKLTDTEIMAIRWHMMAYDDIRCSYAGNLAITNACGKFPIIVLMHIADLSASFLEMRKSPEAGGA